MRKSILMPSLLFMSLIILACAPKAKERKGDADETEILASLKKEPTSQSQLITPETDLYSNGHSKIIKTVDYRFEVESVKKSTEAIEVAIKKYPAYISGSKLLLENPILENKITIRVQNEYFNNLLQDIDQQASFVNFRNVTTDDVSKDFVDLESRLRTKREVEQRYMEILRKKAGTIEELLQAEQQIGTLHEEIEATVSRINYLRDQVNYSTINLEFYQTIKQVVKAGDQITFTNRFIDALTSGWHGVVSIGVALAYIWPLLFIIVGIMFFIRFRKIKSSRLGLNVKG